MTGEELRAWRERLGLSQEGLAQSLGVSQTTITRWERNAANIEHPLILEGALRDLATRLNVAPLEQQAQKAFFTRLYALKQADLGRIRRGDEATIARVVGAVEDDIAFEAIVRLFALHPTREAAEGNFGSTMALLHERRPGSGFDKRFGAIVEAFDFEDGEPLFMHAMKAAAAENLPVNWGSLLNDLAAWNASDRHVQRAWAASFWRKSDDASEKSE
ncbi:MAG: CRISPR-associated protein Cse2 family [Chloroflexi bacterium]|nr:CRISPR-associated protein Cse2 family [Chloroflexota bacterium]